MQLQKCFFERRLKIVKQIEKRFLLYILWCTAFCAILLFGMFYGSQYPNLFFWGLMGILTIFISIGLTPTKKDAIILLVGMVVLSIAGHWVDQLVNFFFGTNSFIGFLVSLVLLSPIYFPLWNHLCKMCQIAAWKMKQADLKDKNN